MKIIFLISFFFVNAYSQDRNGLTWGVALPKRSQTYINVSCHGLPASGLKPSCNAYTGDTSCAERRPVLCINKDKLLAQPSGIGDGKYNMWSGGEVRLTDSIEGYQLNSLESANSLCSEYFGQGWRMAEHHDGWGWGFWAKGNISSEQRFWVHIHDQPANCWDSGPPTPGTKQDYVPQQGIRKPLDLRPTGLLKWM